MPLGPTQHPREMPAMAAWQWSKQLPDSGSAAVVVHKVTVCPSGDQFCDVIWVIVLGCGTSKSGFSHFLQMTFFSA